MTQFCGGAWRIDQSGYLFAETALTDDKHWLECSSLCPQEAVVGLKQEVEILKRQVLSNVRFPCNSAY
eukprot:SAG31_NODE_1271_length_9064_cov_10.148912_6_plen_68_part_00